MLGAVGVLGLLTGVGVWLGGSAGGLLRADDGGRTGVLDVGVLDLRVARDAGLEGGRAEVDVLRSPASTWSEFPLANEDGGSLLGVFVLDFVGVVFTVLGGDLVAAEDGPDLVAGGVTVGRGASGVSMGSGSTGSGGSGSTTVGFLDGGVTSITFGSSGGGEGGASASGEPSSESLARGGVGIFFNSENGEA